MQVDILIDSVPENNDEVCSVCGERNEYGPEKVTLTPRDDPDEKVESYICGDCIMDMMNNSKPSPEYVDWLHEAIALQNKGGNNAT